MNFIYLFIHLFISIRHLAKCNSPSYLETDKTKECENQNMVNQIELAKARKNNIKLKSVIVNSVNNKNL